MYESEQPKEIGFSVDEIYRGTDDWFSVHVIPDFASTFFLPFHLKTINVKPELLEESFYRAYSNVNPDYVTETFFNDIEQGAYYKIPTNVLKERKVFSAGTPIEEDIFSQYKIDSPYSEAYPPDMTLDMREGIQELSSDDNNRLDNVQLHCFNVGQGDTFLLITSNGNAYIIDSNFYSDSGVANFIDKVKTILRSNNLTDTEIKALVITHKHIDHIRGSDQLLEKGAFHVNNLLINLDYEHPTKCVNQLLETAARKVDRLININTTGTIADGKTAIHIRNPDDNTSTKLVAPDINDSSVILHIQFDNAYLYLTGDASYRVLNRNIPNTGSTEGVLKVSHHGSRTGTDAGVLSSLSPTHTFISAGNSRKYIHPHDETINLISNQNTIVDRKISKSIQRRVSYKLNGGIVHVT